MRQIYEISHHQLMKNNISENVIHQSISERLTWDATYPMPFESGWSIFLKVMRLNYLSERELIPLICKENVKANQVSFFDFSNSQWIDFEKFSRLLNVDSRKLKEGFLDKLGFFPEKPSFKRYSIKHCPVCLEHGYHCVFFDLALICECPWHRCKLMAPCINCSTPRIMNGAWKFEANNDREGFGCSAHITKFIATSGTRKFSPEFNALITGYCAELIDWWNIVRERTEMLPDLVWTLSALNRTEDFDGRMAPLLLGFAKDQVPNSLYWKFSISDCTIKYAEWTASNLGYNNEPRACYSTSPAAKIYKSIRRHFYKRYVRPKKEHYNKLIHLDRSSVLNLRADRVCLVVLAYVVWRMSIEGMCRLEGLRYKRKGIFELRLMNPEHQRINLSILDKLRWSYFGFWGVMNELNQTLKIRRRVIVQTSLYSCYPGGFYWNAGKLGENLKNRCDVHLKILVPDMSKLLEETTSITQLRKSKVDEVIDSRARESYFNWSWTIDETSTRTVLFKFTYSPENPKSQFYYVNI